MAQTNPLRYMFRARTPHESVFEAVLESPMNLVADVLDGGVAAHDESLVEGRLDSSPVTDVSGFVLVRV